MAPPAYAMLRPRRWSLWGCLTDAIRCSVDQRDGGHTRCAAAGREEDAVDRRIWRIAAAGAAAGMAVVGVQGVPALAAPGGTGHTVTQTVHQHGTWTETGDTDF